MRAHCGRPRPVRIGNNLIATVNPLKGHRYEGDSRSASYGLWVPCNRINFFHALEDRALLDLHLETLGRQSPWLDFGFRRNDKLDDALGTPSPASSVIRRLLWVLQKCGLVGKYRLRAGPVYRHPEKIDVKFAVTVKAIYELACTRKVDMRIQRVAYGSNEWHEETLAALAERQRKLDVPLNLNITFTAEGLQIWRAVARTGSSGANVDAALRVLQASLMAIDVLDLHPDTVEVRRTLQASSPSPARDPDVWVSDAYGGILPFFQLNVLLGGLFYPGFKPKSSSSATPQTKT